jgi:hypothetical protein
MINIPDCAGTGDNVGGYTLDGIRMSYVPEAVEYMLEQGFSPVETEAYFTLLYWDALDAFSGDPKGTMTAAFTKYWNPNRHNGLVFFPERYKGHE